VAAGKGRKPGELPERRRAEETGVSSEPERLLVSRAQKGDASAYEELVRIHQQRVFAVVSGVLRRREDMEDVAQQVFVKAYFSLPRFDQRAAFGTWLYKIAVNECWDYLRKKKVRPLVYEEDLSEEQVRQFGAGRDQAGAHRFGQETSKQLEQRQLVDRLLAELEERDRLMLILKEVEGFSVEEIGKLLDLNVNTVKGRVFRARARLVELHRRRSLQDSRQEGSRAGRKPGR
jgi:RNA polymerase sigma-70 factor (ECF subfamily)